MWVSFQISAASSLESFKRIVDDALDFRFDCGYSKPSTQLQMSDREKLVRAIWLHFVFFFPHAELAQLQKGLRETLQLEDLICAYPKEVYSLLVPSSDFDVAANFFIDEFIVLYSEAGHNNRTKEESVYLSWCEYIMECSGRFGYMMYASLLNTPCICLLQIIREQFHFLISSIFCLDHPNYLHQGSKITPRFVSQMPTFFRTPPPVILVSHFLGPMDYFSLQNSRIRWISVFSIRLGLVAHAERNCCNLHLKLL